MKHQTKTIVITGGIVSGIGKGITSASIGRLLIDCGYTVAPIKADPYLNQDAGTMNPFQHGEVFVTNDGAETDLDLGHYERFLDLELGQYSNFTSGSVYRAVMDLERDGEFLGKTIQIIPHVTNEIKHRLELAKEKTKPDFLLCEIGGTIGDIEALPFVEAIRQYASENKNTLFVHVVKMDYLYPSDEGKTKPIQHSVTTLRSYGIQPDILIVRCKRPLTDIEKEKISLFTGVKTANVIMAEDASSLYDIPSRFKENGIVEAVLGEFNMNAKTHNPAWDTMLFNMNNRKKTVNIGLLGKYIEHDDAYISVFESIKHAGIYYQAYTKIIPINSELPEKEITKAIKTVDAVIVPGGFGNRGIEGKIAGIKVARENKIPFLGICLGLQTAIIEIARNMAGLPEANSREFNSTCQQCVIDILPDQINIKKKGGTMRLGAYPAVLKKNTLAYKLYKKYRENEIGPNGEIHERHRHRYEINPEYHEILKNAGVIFSGMSPDGSLAEFIELPSTTHPYFIATQAHPEFRSRPHRPHPLFAGLIKASLNKIH